MSGTLGVGKVQPNIDFGKLSNQPLHQTPRVTVCADAQTAPPAAGERQTRWKDRK
jgi:hypothetical protein